MSDTLPSRAAIQSFYMPPGAPRKPRIARAEGIWFEDTEGNRLIDASSGPVASNLGHGNPRVLDAMMRQARTAAFAYPLQFESEANVAIAERLARLCGPGLDRAFLVSGGSEAVETAIRFARQHAVVRGEPARAKVIARQPGYHGNTLGALAVSGDKAQHAMFGPLFRAMPKIPAPFTYRLPPNHTAESHARACAAALEAKIVEEGAETILAFIMEPVGGLATGALVAPDCYYTLVRDICTRHGVTLIYDEVMSGAGRTGRFLAADHWPGARPDIVVLAKGVTAGYTPMGVVMVAAQAAEDLAASGGFMAGFTYFANPLSCAIGAAVLDELTGVHTGRNLIDNAAAMGDRMRARLEAMAAESRIVGDVRGRGLLLAIELVADKGTQRMIPLPLMAPYRVQAIGMKHGLALYCRRTGGGEYGDWVMVSPPLIVTADDVDTIAQRLTATLRDYETELAEAGVLHA
ncbi:MAG: aspartate aminotransferase family protein [Gemmatimonadaceae bacterium]|nr:aspartate aminotransferase family protein [Acetobacteraceae bacterium]